VAAAALALAPVGALAQSRPELIPVPGRMKMALYRPDSGPAPTVGIIVMHRTSNYLIHRACTELSRRGFLMLCMNSRYENNEPAVDFEKLPLDVKRGVEFLRKQAGITKVVLFGHSGGGPIMALYQAVAEKGIAYCQDANKLTRCGDDLAGLPPVDGIVFTDAHPGNAINLLRGINPSVANENNPPDAPSVAALDPFSAANGFNPNGPSNYSAEFQDRYFRAQATRMNRLIESARDKLDRMTRNVYPYPDDDVIVIPRGGNPGSGPGASAALFVAMPSLAAVNSTAKPARLLRNDGSIATQIIRSVYVADPKLSRANLRFGTGTKIYTLRSFLSANAIRARHALDDIDYCSTNNSTVCAIQSITVPVLFTAMGAHYFIRATSGCLNCPPARTKTSSLSRARFMASRRARAAKPRPGNIRIQSRTCSITSRSGSTTATDNKSKRRSHNDRRLHLDHRQRPKSADFPGRDRHAIHAAHGGHS
jgi:pimeloyl-ACP methyl ester carboxylesterase